MANKEKLTEVLTFINAHRDLLNMGEWLECTSPLNNMIEQLKLQNFHQCGTTGCIAGWTVLLNGWFPTSESLDHVQHPQEETAEYIDNAAASILELNSSERIKLFYCTAEELNSIVTQIINGESDDAA